MRQPLALALCAFLLAIPTADTHAQERTTDFILGAGATMGLATDEDATESRIGRNASGGFSLPVVDAIGLRVEAGYIEKGAGAEVNEGGAAGRLLFTEGLTEIFAGDNAPDGRNRTISLVGSFRIPLAG